MVAIFCNYVVESAAMKCVKFDGQKLKQLRKERRMTQKEVGDIVGKTVSDISNYENGFATPPADVLLSLQKMFDADFSSLSVETS